MLYLRTISKTLSIACDKLVGTPAVTTAINGGRLALSFV